MTTMQQVSNQEAHAVTVNRNFKAVAPAALYGKREAQSAALIWAYYGGIIGNPGSYITVPDGQVTLTDNTTNLLEVDAAGAVHKVTGANTAGRIPIWDVTLAGGVITAEVDRRVVYSHFSLSPTYTTITINTGTITANTPGLNIIQNWNNAAVDFVASDMNITEQTPGSSGAGSLLQRWRFAGAIKASLSKAGAMVLAAGLTLAGPVAGATDINMSGNLIVGGNMTVNGTTTIFNSTVVTVDDPIFTLGGDTPPAVDDNKDRGIEFRWHNGSVAKAGFFGYDDSAGVFTFIPDATNTAEVFTGTAGNVAFGNGTFVDITSSGVHSAGIGSVGTPSLNFTDPTTGFFRNGVNQIGLAVSGAINTAWIGGATITGHNASIVGASSVQSSLQVVGTSGNTSSAMIARFSAGSTSPILYLAKSLNATIGSHTQVTTNIGTGIIQSIASGDSSSFVPVAQIAFACDVTGAAGVVPGRVTVATANAAGAMTGAIWIDSAQQVNIGISAPSFKFGVSGTYTSANASYTRITSTVVSSVTSNQYMMLFDPTLAPSGGSLTSAYGIYVNPAMASGAAAITNFSPVTGVIETLAGYTNAITNGRTFQALTPTLGGSLPITNYLHFQGNAITNGNGITSGVVTNYNFGANAPTAAAGVGGTVVNYGFWTTMGTGSSAGTTNYGLRITGTGGALSTNWAVYSDSTNDWHVAGNVLFGSTTSVASPLGTAKIQVSGTGATLSQVARFSNDTTGAYFVGLKSAGTSVGTHGNVASGTDLVTLAGYGSYDGDWRRAGLFLLETDAAGTGTEAGGTATLQGRWVMFTTAAGAPGVLTEAARWNSAQQTILGGAVGGAVGTPVLAFHTSDISSGFYRAGANQIGLTISGANLVTWAANAITYANGGNLVFGTTTGTKFGTSASQKMGWWNATPVVQPAGWGSPTGAATRTTFDTATVTLAQLAERVKAMIDDNKTMGLYGA